MGGGTHVHELAVVLELPLQGLDVLLQVLGLGPPPLLQLLQAALLLLQLALQQLEARQQAAAVLVRLPLHVQLLLGQALRLPQQLWRREDSAPPVRPQPSKRTRTVRARQMSALVE